MSSDNALGSKKRNTKPGCFVVAFTVYAFSVLAGCDGTGISSGGGEENANHCFSQNVQENSIQITNTCDKTIVVKTTAGHRRVIAPGEQQTIPKPSSRSDRFAACFSPDEPEFEDNGFICD